MKMRHRGIAAVALSCSVLLAACRSAPTKTYTLYPVAPTSPRRDYAGPPVRVDAVHLPPALNRLELVTSLGPGEMKLDELAHWSAPLNQIARQILSEDLLARLPAGGVIFPRLPKPSGSPGISVDVLDLQVGRTGATLQASWTIDTGGPTADARGGTATLRTGTPAPDAPATASAISALFGQLADRIAATLQAP